MKTKNLFLTLVLFLLLPMSAKAAVSTDVFIVPTGVPDIYATVNPSSYGATSGAKYSGEVDYDSNYPLVWLDNSKVWATIMSPGKAKSVTIYWDLSEDYNVEDESIIRIYGQNEAYTGSETLGTMTGSLLASQAYDGSSSHTLDISSSDCSFIAIVGSPDAGIAFNRLEIAWTVPDVAKYAIATSKTGKGSISVSPASPVPAGTTVTVTFSGTGSANEVNSFVIDGVSTVLSEDEYTKSVSRTFTMPAHAVDISAVFGGKPSRIENPVSVDGKKLDFSTSLESGVSTSFTIATDYNESTSPVYNQPLKSVTSAYGRVQIVSNTYSSETGTGTLTLRGLTTGDDVLTITTYQTNGLSRSTRNINITVVSRDVALVTELNDKYYAVTTSIGGSTATACELLYDGDNYYYKSGVSVSDLTWKMENANAAGTKFRIKNSAGKYLSIDAATMSMEDAAFDWSLNPDDRLITGYLTGLCYSESYSAFTVNNHNENMSVSSISQCIHEIPISSIKAASEYTRGLTSGNYATICLPYSISRSETFFSGVEVYNITGKYMSDDKVTGIEMEEETGVLEAGTPYIIKATASSLSAWHGDMTYFAIKGYATGLVGKLDAATEYVPIDCYGLSSNQLRRVAYANTAKVGQYKAYIDLSAVPEVGGGGASAPGRIVLYAQPEEMENNGNNDNNGNTGEGSEVATSLEDFLNNASPINWNEPVYNTLGQRVGKGSTGVLIQNGQKFLVK